MPSLYDITGDISIWVAAACVFVSVGLLWYLLAAFLMERLTAYQENFTTSASSNMSDMFMFVDPQKLLRWHWMGTGILVFVVGAATRDIPATLAMFAVAALLPAFLYKRMRKRRLNRIERQLPDALAIIASSLRAGASLGGALEGMVQEQPPPISQEFELFLREQRLGVEFEQSLANMEQRIPIGDFALLVTALRINREVGGNIAVTLEGLGETLRRKAMMEGKIQSLTAQGKLQGIVMTGLPLLLAGLLSFMEPEAMSKLWTTPLGWGVCVVVVVMEAMGFVMINKITSIDV